jgi:uncharacterized protein (UPF0147 family)
MKPAHIINLPNVEVGDKALTVCGVKHLVRVRWDDLPDDHPICRACVDKFIIATNELNDQVSDAMRQALRVTDALNALTDALVDQNTMTDILDDTAAYAAKRLDKQAKKERKQAEKSGKTCSCKWTDLGERLVEDPNCPVHGAPVAPEEGYTPRHRAGDGGE